MVITVASWNIWVFGDRDTEAMAEIIQENDIDIIGIQEAAIYFDEDEPRHIAEEIAEELGYHYTFYPAIDFRPEKPYKMGNAVISRYPIESSDCYELNPEELEYDGSYQTEPRIAVEAEVNIEGERVSFLSTHLQYSYKFKTTETRKQQVQNLLSAVKTIKNPVVLTGDFNATLDNEEIQMLEDQMERIGDDEPTWTVQPFEHEGWKVNELKYRLDNIFTTEGITCKNAGTIKTEVSDHLPIKAEVKNN